MIHVDGWELERDGDCVIMRQWIWKEHHELVYVRRDVVRPSGYETFDISAKALLAAFAMLEVA